MTDAHGKSKAAVPTDVVICRFDNFAKPLLTKLDTLQLLLDLVDNISFVCIALLHSHHQCLVDDLCTSAQQLVNFLSLPITT